MIAVLDTQQAEQGKFAHCLEHQEYGLTNNLISFTTHLSYFMHAHSTEEAGRFLKGGKIN